MISLGKYIHQEFQIPTREKKPLCNFISLNHLLNEQVNKNERGSGEIKLKALNIHYDFALIFIGGMLQIMMWRRVFFKCFEADCFETEAGFDEVEDEIFNAMKRKLETNYFKNSQEPTTKVFSLFSWFDVSIHAPVQIFDKFNFLTPREVFIDF